MSLLSKILILFLVPAAFCQVSFTTSNDGTSSLIWNGVEYNYKNVNEGPLYRFYYGPSNTEVFPSGCTRSHTSTAVTQNCSTGISISTLTTYESVGTDTVKVTMALTNNDATLAVNSAQYTLLGITTAAYNAGASRLTTTAVNNAVSIVDAVAVRVLTWLDSPEDDTVGNAGVSYSISHTASGAGPYFFKNSPSFTASVLPGETRTLSAYMKFTSDMSSSRYAMVPEAYSAIRSLYPQVTNWPDRRPIAALFVGEYTQRSATNPRGYWQNSALNAVGDQTAFNAAGNSKVNTVIAGMLASPVRAQGVVVWDIEGQEFRHATTYIGDPRILGSGYAPEMNSYADTMFAAFRAAGFKVGVTIRPQYLTYGTSLPGTCTYNSDTDLNEYYIVVNAAYLSKFYDCDSSGASWNIDSNGSGAQIGYVKSTANVANVLTLLRSKIDYARARWGATLFYLDSAVWMVSGNTINPYIMRVLQAEYPDCLIMSEQEDLTTMAASIPFTDSRNGLDPDYTPSLQRWVYPTAAMWPNWYDCTGACWTGASASFQIGLRIGDIPGFLQWASWYHQPEMESLWATVNSSTSSMNFIYVTDSGSGAVRSFKSAPKTSFKYPLVSRVYFASSSGGLAASTLYCEAGTNPSQDAFQGSNSCTLNLSGMTVSQIRYYDFAGNQVSEGPYATLQ